MYTVEALLNLAIRSRIIAANVARAVFKPMRPKIETDIAEMAPDEAVAELRSLQMPLASRAILELLLNTRPSPEELSVLRVSDLSMIGTPDQWTVTYRFKLERGAELEQARPKRIRTVPLDLAGPAVLEWLNSGERPNSNYVFPKRQGQRRDSTSFVRSTVTMLQQQAGMGSDRPWTRSPDGKKPEISQRFSPLHSILALSNVAIVKWYSEKPNYLRIMDLAGFATDRSLTQFQPYFDEVDMDHAGIDAIDSLFRGPK